MWTELVYGYLLTAVADSTGRSLSLGGLLVVLGMLCVFLGQAYLSCNQPQGIFRWVQNPFILGRLMSILGFMVATRSVLLGSVGIIAFTVWYRLRSAYRFGKPLPTPGYDPQYKTLVPLAFPQLLPMPANHGEALPGTRNFRKAQRFIYPRLLAALAIFALIYGKSLQLVFTFGSWPTIWLIVWAGGLIAVAVGSGYFWLKTQFSHP